MRRIALPELAALVLGGALVAAGLAKGVAPEVHYLWLLKERLVKGAALVAGGGLALLGLWSWRRPESWFRRPRVRETLARLALVGLSSAVALGLAEVALQVAGPPQPRDWRWIEPDELLHHAHVPGRVSRFRSGEWDVEVRINEAGLRDEELVPRSSVDLRILVLGDSFTFGYGVEAEATFPERLEARLAAAGRRADVVNAAVISYSPILEYLYLRERGLALEPDVVVVAFDMSDFQDDLVYEGAAVRDAAGALQAVHPGPVGSGRRLVLPALLRSGADALYGRWRSGRELDLPQTRDLRHNRFALTRDDVPPADAEPHWRRTLGYLELLFETARRGGARPVLLTYPYGHQVAPEEWSLGRHHYGFAAQKVYPDAPARRLEAFAASRDVTFVSAFATMRREAGGLYFPRDGHFTPRGHELVAELLERELGAAGLLGAAGPAAGALVAAGSR